MDSIGSEKEESSMEERLLNLMRIAVEAHDSSAKWSQSYVVKERRKTLRTQSYNFHLSFAADDATVMRFLRARDFNVQKASQFFLKYLNWRRAFVPLGYIPESEVCNELEKKKIFIQGFDKQGHPIGVILAARHNSDRDLEEFKRLVVYGFDKICACLPSEQEKFTIIADLEGWGYKNTDIRAYLAALEIMQNFYPERLGKVLMIHVPYLFWAAWKIVYPFIDNVTKKKIIFVEDKHLKETLLSEIDESQVPEIYGGKLPLVPAQDCITTNSAPVTSSNEEVGFR
ncbi:uncharacterized protein LOC131075952 isoform X1 [Cryptomeria japonica]|uniref:uncharacterized protein LOC131075952 isoform X1 n=1 Tax=Cryptomeria japonica TaxID=3369 RepID=UPI0027DA7125|nr:uncharacterized protein LOC131075952 isoform X1 [Cryptomeria japonica]